jgi:hypothetical protein
MNPVGRLCLCIAGGVALLSVAARGDTTPSTPGTTMMNKALMMEKLHRHAPNMQHAAPGLPQFSSPNAAQPTTLAAPTMPRPNIASAPAAAKSAAPSGNPYDSIVTRNVFGLNPIPPPEVVKTPDGPPPPKITLTGIMTIFGTPEALFKVAGVVRRGAAPHDESYIFTEGEMQDDVQVTKIDTKKNIVTFMNHRVEQEIPLTDNGVASTGSAPSQPSWPGQNGGPRHFGRIFNHPTAGGSGSFPRPPGGGYSPGGFNPGRYNGSSSGFNNTFGGGSYGGSYNASASSQPVLSSDDQAALIAAEHAQAVQQGSPTAILYPSTTYDKDAMDYANGSGGSGNPGTTPAPTPPVRPGGYPR